LLLVEEEATAAIKAAEAQVASFSRKMFLHL